MLLVPTLLLLIQFTPTLLADFKVPGIDIEIPIEIPGLPGLSKKEPPITTSIKDAVTDVPFLDSFDPQKASPLTLVPRAPDGTLNLLPGLWEVTLQSYCLHAGAYRPTRGDGYAYAPLKGPQAGVIQTILRNSVKHPEIPQEDIQTLIWAILARTKISDLSPDQQSVAEQLLTQQQIDKLNGGALGKIPPDVLSRALGKLPPVLRQALEAEARLHDLLTSGVNMPYAEIERVAVLEGDPEPPEGSREVPWGRWSYHPSGFFVRYMPSGYSTTLNQLYVPEDIDIQTDELGRIKSVADPAGCCIETDYDDTIGALTLTGDPGVKGYAFKLIRITAPDPDRVGEMRKTEYPETGWTLVGVPSGRGRVAVRDERYMGATERYQAAVSWWKQLQALNQTLAKLAGVPKPETHLETLSQIINLSHYAAALRAVVPTTTDAQEEGAEPAAPDEIGLVYRAWQTRVAHLASALVRTSGRVGGTYSTHIVLVSDQPAGGGRDSAAGRRLKKYDPSGDSAAPGNSGRQRLGQSGRKAGAGEDDPISKARRYTRFVSTGSSVAWRVGTGGGAPWGVPSLGLGKVLDFNFDAWSRAADALAGDPPRDDYDVLATLDVPAFNPLDEQSDVSPVVTHAMNSFLEAAYHLTAQLRMACISRDRMGGALLAGNDEWAERQAIAAVEAQRRAGHAMLVVADRLDELLEALDKGGVDDFVVPEEAVAAYYQELQTTGFRTEEIQVAHSIGLTDAELEDSRNDRLSFEPASMTGSLRAGAKEAASALRELGEYLARLPASG